MSRRGAKDGRSELREELSDNCTLLQHNNLQLSNPRFAPRPPSNIRLSERDSFGVVVLTNVKPTRRMGLKVAYMSEETGLRRVATVVGVTGTGSGTSYIVKNEDDEETFTGMGKVFIVLSKMPESRKNAAKVDNRKKRKYIRKENNKRKGSDEDLPDVDMKLEDDEEVRRSEGREERSDDRI